MIFKSVSLFTHVNKYTVSLIIHVNIYTVSLFTHVNLYTVSSYIHSQLFRHGNIYTPLFCLLMLIKTWSAFYKCTYTQISHVNIYTVDR